MKTTRMTYIFGRTKRHQLERLVSALLEYHKTLKDRHDYPAASLIKSMLKVWHRDSFEPPYIIEFYHPAEWLVISQALRAGGMNPPAGSEASRRLSLYHQIIRKAQPLSTDSGPDSPSALPSAAPKVTQCVTQTAQPAPAPVIHPDPTADSDIGPEQFTHRVRIDLGFRARGQWRLLMNSLREHRRTCRMAGDHDQAYVTQLLIQSWKSLTPPFTLEFNYPEEWMVVSRALRPLGTVALPPGSYHMQQYTLYKKLTVALREFLDRENRQCR